MANPHSAAEWRAHWPVVAAATTGYSLSVAAPMAIGLFIQPLGQAFGWGRALVTGGMFIASIQLVLLSPFIGALIDRWGSRRLALPSIILTGASLMAMGLANGSAWQWLGMWTVFGLVTFGIKPTIWTAAVAGCFSEGLGLALGITVCGTAISEILVPPVLRYLIDAQGWRHAFFWLGAGAAAPSLVMSTLFLRDVRRDRPKGASHRAAAAGEGLSVRQALRNPALLRIGAATLIMIFAGTAALVHQVPILVEAGVTRTNAAWLASLAGLAGIIGKLVTGWLTDRPRYGLVAPITIASPAVGFTILMLPSVSPPLIVTAMLVIGYSAGAKMQISAYLTGRYAGMRNFGKVFGAMTSLIALGGGLGPFAAGAAFDIFHSYAPLLIFGAGGSLVAALLLFRLGPYPVWDRPSDAATSDLASATPFEPAAPVVSAGRRAKQA